MARRLQGVPVLTDRGQLEVLEVFFLPRDPASGPVRGHTLQPGDSNIP